MEDILKQTLEHIRRVEHNCEKIAIYFMRKGNLGFALQLISNGRMHDVSKLGFYEFNQLSNWKNEPTPEENLLQQNALNIHRNSNPHHPEYWKSNGIHDMPDLYIAEMVCDWFARAEEFGTDVNDWIKKKGTKTYNFKMSDRVGKKIKEYLSILTKNKFK